MKSWFSVHIVGQERQAQCSQPRLITSSHPAPGGSIIVPIWQMKTLRLRNSPHRARNQTRVWLRNPCCFHYTMPPLSLPEKVFPPPPRAAAPEQNWWSLDAASHNFPVSPPLRATDAWPPTFKLGPSLPPPEGPRPPARWGARPAGNTHGSRRPRRLLGAHPLPGLRPPPRQQPNAGLSCLLSLGHQIILALAEGTDGNWSHMENEPLSNSALAESRHLRGNCSRRGGGVGVGGVLGGRVARRMGEREGGQEGGRQWPSDYLLDESRR